MRVRVGLWLVVAAAFSSVGFVVGLRAFSADSMLNSSETEVGLGVVSSIDAALGVMLAAGVGIAAATTSGSRAAWWWVSAVALALLPAVTIATLLGADLESFVHVTARTVGMLGIAAFGAGLRAAGGATRLVWPTVVLGCAAGALSVVSRGGSPWLFASGIHILVMFGALDLLGAFPPIDRAAAIPQARVARSRVRTVAAASSLALIAGGLLLGSLVVRGITAGAHMHAEHLTGMTCGVAGLTGLWRLRGRRVFVSVVFAILFLGFGLISEAVTLLEPRIDEVSLTVFDAPEVSISLPDGATYRGDASGFDLVHVRPNHHDLSEIVFAWGLAEVPTLREDLDVSSKDLQIGSGDVRRHVAHLDSTYYGSLVWSCDGERWMTAGFSALGRANKGSVERLLDRIASTIVCR